MDIIQAILLALVQGVTEFLPVSSSAHLVLLSEMSGWRNYLVFDVVIHAGTLSAVVFYYRKPLLTAILTPDKIAFPNTGTQGKDLLLYMLVGSLPILLVGFFLHDFIESNLRTPILIAAMTIVFALFLWFADIVNSYSDKLTWKIAIWVGLGQILALIPGVSRAGITISVGRVLGLSYRSAADFSFLLAIPAILAATLYELFVFYSSPHPELAVQTLLIGFLVSAIFAFFSIDIFLRFVARIGFLPFVIYRILIGGVILFIYL